MELIIASTNKGKIKEIGEILKGLPISLSSLIDYNDIPDIIEDGSTFLENAMIKAKTVYDLFKKPVLADDSGLVIPALNGEPGVRSARYGSDDGEKPKPDILIKRVLKNMTGISKRKAYFKAVIVLFLGYDNHIAVEGECYGEIADKPMGNRGFGYDPIFYLSQYNKTMAQIEPEQKNAISHRGIALVKLRDSLSSLFN